MAEEVVESVAGPYYSVEITKNSKGYGWSIKVSNSDDSKLKDKLVELEKFCKDKFGEA